LVVTTGIARELLGFIWAIGCALEPPPAPVAPATLAAGAARRHA
jgi:hypothetical protein